MELCPAVCVKVFRLCVYLFSWRNEDEHSDTVKDSVDFVKNYRSRFHPLAAAYELFSAPNEDLRKCRDCCLETKERWTCTINVGPPNTLYRSAATVQVARTLVRILTIMKEVLDATRSKLGAINNDVGLDDDEKSAKARDLVLTVFEDWAWEVVRPVERTLVAISQEDLPFENGRRGLTWSLRRIETSAERVRSYLGRNDLYALRTETRALVDDLEASSCGCLILK